MKFFLLWVVSVMSVVMMMPFLTLLERKVLSYIQIRKGPKKVSYMGVLQPLADGLKLFIKEGGSVVRSKKLFFWFMPLLNFFFMLMLFILFVPIFSSFSIKLGLIIYLCFSSLLVYTILISGWSSNSKFAFLGSLRGGAQIISYEMALLTLVFFPSLLVKSFNLISLSSSYLFTFCFFFIILMFWLMTMVAETKRSPFDFAEGESELVSGFNTEYSSMIFALLFLGEYGNMIFVSFFTTFLFFPSSIIFRIFMPLIIMFMFLLFRGTFPRFRYDFLMSLVWKFILPLSLILFWLVFMM